MDHVVLGMIMMRLLKYHFVKDIDVAYHLGSQSIAEVSSPSMTASIQSIRCCLAHE